jgi:predicted transcriptional regulator of viral defense system
MLDGFIAPRRFGGMGEVLGILEAHVDQLELPKLVEYALRCGKGAAVKRLGWALEQVGIPPDTTAPLLDWPVAGYRALDPTRAAQGKCDRRWRIVNNLAAPRITEQGTALPEPA